MQWANKLIEQMREKNRTRLVTATFRGKFLRAPSPAELSHWLAVFQADADFQLFLRQIAEAVVRDQPLLGVKNFRDLPTEQDNASFFKLNSINTTAKSILEESIFMNIGTPSEVLNQISILLASSSEASSLSVSYK